MSIEENGNEVVALENISPEQIRTKKIAICAVSLGVAIIREMIGSTITTGDNDTDLEELMAAAITNELQL